MNEYIKIGNVKIRKTAALAPMAGVADRAYRLMCKKFGAAYLVSEMVSAKGICYGDKKTAQLCTVTDVERPMAVQLFGSEPEFMAEAVKIVLGFSPDIIDINMGCPVPKVINTGSGSEILKSPDLAAKLTESAVKAAGDTPVT
ncbi:MAG: tRNA dihydrouridine synthase, partial [Ruminococcus sp.]